MGVRGPQRGGLQNTNLKPAVSSEGRLLAFPIGELPEMEKGRGTLIFGIPGRKARTREELLVDVAVLPGGARLLLHCGDRRMTLAGKELDAYLGNRGQRGALLPRGWRKVDRLEVEGGPA